MRDAPRRVVTDAFRWLARWWGRLALTDITYKTVAFALLAPATILLLRWTIG